MFIKSKSMNKIILGSLLVLVFSISSISTAYAAPGSLEFQHVDIYCSSSGTELDFSGIGTFFTMCPAFYPTDHDLLWTANEPILAPLQNAGLGSVQLNFTMPTVQGLSNVTGFTIERATGATFSTLFNDTGDTDLFFFDNTVNLGIFYKYQVAAWNDQGLGEYSNIQSIVTSDIVPDTFCDGVDGTFELQTQTITDDSVLICWDLFPTGTSIPGYMINYTSPWAEPLSILVTDTGTNATRSYLVENLQPNTQYSFKVKALNEGSLSNRLDVLTLGSDFDIGSFTVVTDTNPNAMPFFFTETSLNSTQTQLDIDFDNTLLNVTCDMRHQFGQVNNTYTDINENSVVTTDSHNRTTFIFNGIQNDVISIDCYEGDTEGTYVITQTGTGIPLVDQIGNFRDGTYGTTGMFGAFDLITLFAILLSMIAFNRVNAGAGAIFTVIIVGALASIGIIQWPTIVLSAIALIVLLAVVTHSRDDVSE
jgi:hypothetical protein